MQIKTNLSPNSCDYSYFILNSRYFASMDKDESSIHAENYPAQGTITLVLYCYKGAQNPQRNLRVCSYSLSNGSACLLGLDVLGLLLILPCLLHLCHECLAEVQILWRVRKELFYILTLFLVNVNGFHCKETWILCYSSVTSLNLLPAVFQVQCLKVCTAWALGSVGVPTGLEFPRDWTTFEVYFCSLPNF